MSNFTFNFTQAQVQEILGCDTNTAAELYKIFVTILPQYKINTPERVASFIGQCAHESGNFKVLKENLNYSWQGLRNTFPKYFPNDSLAQSYARQPMKIADKVYANRMGNGSEASHDGSTYCGRGAIQLTGKTNYSLFGQSIKKTLDETVKYLETKQGAIESACWFWDKNNLNALADKQDNTTITKRINGGTNGLADRVAKTTKALRLFKR